MTDSHKFIIFFTNTGYNVTQTIYEVIFEFIFFLKMPMQNETFLFHWWVFNIQIILVIISEIEKPIPILN